MAQIIIDTEVVVNIRMTQEEATELFLFLKESYSEYENARAAKIRTQLLEALTT